MDPGSTNKMPFHCIVELDDLPKYEISEYQKERILEGVKTQKYHDIIKKLNSIHNSAFLSGDFLSDLRNRTIWYKNLAVYAYLLQRFPSQIISQLNETMKTIIGPGVSVDTFAGIMSTRPRLCGELKKPVTYMLDMITQYYESINRIGYKGSTPEVCYCFEELIWKIIYVLKIPIVDTSESIHKAFVYAFKLHYVDITTGNYSNQILCLLINHAKKNNLYFDVAHIPIFSTLRYCKQPLTFIKVCHEILKLPIDIKNRYWGNLLWAVRDIECAQYLIENGLDVHWRNVEGRNIVQEMIYNLDVPPPRYLGGNLVQYMQWLVTRCDVDMGTSSQIKTWIDTYKKRQKGFEDERIRFELFDIPLRIPNHLSPTEVNENKDIISWVLGYLKQTKGSKKSRLK